MAFTHRSQHVARWGGASEWLHRHFLGLLVACYVLAALWPIPGLALRNARLSLPGMGAQNAPMLLLALLLFCASLSVRWQQAKSALERPSATAWALVAAWIAPGLLVTGLGTLLTRWGEAASASGWLVGLALVAAMPVANSSAGWSQNSGGNVALSLALIVASIVLSPLATPRMLQLMGWAMSADEAETIGRAIAKFSGSTFIAWVLLPSLAGGATAWLAGASRVARWRPWLRLITLVDLLLLNYANASLALQETLHDESWTSGAIAGCLALALSLVGAAAGAFTGRLLRLDAESRTSLLYGLSMKHTGLALVVAGEALPDQPRVILLIVLATLAQHLVAATIDWRRQTRNVPDAPGAG